MIAENDFHKNKIENYFKFIFHSEIRAHKGK